MHIRLPAEHWLLTAPLYRPSEVMAKPCPVPAVPGVYAWFFRTLFDGMHPADRIRRDAHTLLYVGISPSSARGKSTLRKRLVTHCGATAYRSTLRYTLGALLRDELALAPSYPYKQPRPVFGEGEARLSAWLNDNARVAWHEHPEPWDAERDLIHTLDLPLNLRDNTTHPFYPRLSEARRTLANPTAS